MRLLILMCAILVQPLHALDVVSQSEHVADGMVATLMHQHNIPGLTLSVVYQGRTIVAKGYGYADLQQQVAVDPDLSLFRIGSTSKTFTC